MRYYSDILDEFFETEEQCKKAESECIEDMVPPEDEESLDECCVCEKSIPCNECKVEEKKETTPTKKDLADRVQECEEKVKEAYELYSVAEKKANELSKQYLEEVDKIMSPAKKAVKDAEAEKYKAIKDFNDAYGVYRVSYTGARAAEEFNRALRKFEDTHKWVDSIFTWF